MWCGRITRLTDPCSVPRNSKFIVYHGRMPHGGARPGAGRPKGSRDRRPRLTATRKLLEQAKIKAADFEMPVDRLLRRMNDRSLPEPFATSLRSPQHPM